MSGSTARDLFARHLDLAPLRGRERGLVRCPFHKDPHASLSVDFPRGLFHCFGCGAGGGLTRFRELVGETVPHAAPRRRTESDLQLARRQVLREERARAARRAEWADLHIASLFIRRCDRAAQEARKLGTALGPEHPRTWPLLELAAQVEREGLTVEAELDAILASGRIA